MRSRTRARWRVALHEIIFEADTWRGRAFDLGLLVLILLSISAVLLESVESIRTDYGGWLTLVEWTLTAAFSIEYVLRLASVDRPFRYATSFFGLVDLASVAPTYISLVVPGTHPLLVIRALRLLRVFRVLKVAPFVREANTLLTAIRHSFRKIALFLGSVMILVLILGSTMYVVEGGQGGFTSIPRSIYWAIVTMTTVGYGDITPTTPLGQFLASIVMLTGYAILAVPTGIVTAELVREARNVTTRTCPACLTEGHERRARFCSDCGVSLVVPSAPPPA